MTWAQISLLLAVIAYLNAAFSFYLFQAAMLSNIEDQIRPRAAKSRGGLLVKKKNIESRIILRTLFWPLYFLTNDKKA